MKPILKPLSIAINRFLQLDPESATRLHKLADHVVCIELQPFAFTFYCHFTQTGIELTQASNKDADTKITGTPLQMAGVVLHKSNRQAFFAEDVQITGDVELGQQVIELFDECEIDWQEQASQIIGDVPTHQLNRVVQGIKNWIKNTDKRMTENMSDYIHEEKQWMPARSELADFFSDIDTLRMDVDRMEVRINALLKDKEQP